MTSTKTAAKQLSRNVVNKWMVLKIVRWLLLALSGAVLLIFLLLSVASLLHPLDKSITLTSKKLPPFSEYINDEAYIRELEKGFGNKKRIPFQYNKQILIALSHFPELKSASINFLIDKANFPLQSRPEFFSLLLPGVKRKYKIIISNRSIPEYEDILLDRIPLEGQIGVLGHELAHVADYENKTSLEIALIGIQYLLSAEFRGKFERMTDSITIEHGMGNYLLNWREYYEDLLTRDEQRPFKQKIYFEDRYLTASEIKRIMEKE